ncbi:MAG: trypsin-like peptidase domain-containing protein [Planctomycetota bacterium]|nr:trypsin-like peptidase domain-containing protein [Planctomycetota bacterium]
MKRTLIEVTFGLAALVAMVSFHHQITRLEGEHKDVAALKTKVDALKVSADSKTEELQQRKASLSANEERLSLLEQQLTSATAGSTLAQNLQSELTKAKGEVNNFRSQIAMDFERTKALVDAYISEVRSKQKDAAMRLSETQGAIAAIACQLNRDPGELTRSMLLPTVQLNGEDTVGSGTLVYSDLNPKSGKVESYVLTSYHVVRNILADTPKSQTEGFSVTVYLQNDKVEVKGKMTASFAKIDAALVQLQTDRRFPHIATVMPQSECINVKVWDPVCAVGCPLGNDPVPSEGEVSSLKNELNGANYWMINAPTYFGNSGGGVYQNNSHQLIGVFSKIYTHGKGTPVVIPHMGLCTPISLIYEWLRQEGLDYLLAARPKQIDQHNLSAPAK